ncbi:MAG: hypothetical protein LBS21_14875 [Clostridiales bacterium]|nr:hypothetical protein [Clostridiales bacterium]
MLESIITELIKIENKVQEVTLKTDEQIRNFPDLVAKRKKEIDDAIAAETSEKSNKLQEMAKIESEKKLEKIKADALEKVEKIKSLYNQIHEKTEGEIFNSIILAKRD